MVATHLWDSVYVTLKYTMMVDVADSHANRVILEVSQIFTFDFFLGCLLSVQVVWEPLILVN